MVVVDDSAWGRREVTHILAASPLVEVVASCADGESALRACHTLEPDLVTLDLEMPGMDGFTFLRLLMAQRPTPVVVVSGRSAHSDVFRALELGAVDFVAKPHPGASEALESIEPALLRRVHAVRELRLDRMPSQPASTARRVTPAPAVPGRERAIVIGASTGGPRAILQLLGAFASALPYPVLIAQHMPPGFTHGFAERIERLTAFGASEARDGDVPRPGCVYVAPGGRQLEVEAAGERRALRVSPPDESERHAPSVDRLFASAAKCWGEGLLALVLTGMGSDGREGARAVAGAGGRVWVESERSAVVHGMPCAVLHAGVAARVLALDRLPAALRQELAAPDARGRGAGASRCRGET